MKKILLTFAGIAPGCLLLITALEHSSRYVPSKEIHKNVPVQTRKFIVIHASPEKVWNVMAQVNLWSSWQNDIEHSELKGSFYAGNSFTWQSGGLHIRSTIHAADQYRKISWSGPAFGSFAIHNWRFAPLAGGYTRVQVEENMEGWLVYALSPIF